MLGVPWHCYPSFPNSLHFFLTIIVLRLHFPNEAPASGYFLGNPSFLVCWGGVFVVCLFFTYFTILNNVMSNCKPTTQKLEPWHNLHLTTWPHPIPHFSPQNITIIQNSFAFLNIQFNCIYMYFYEVYSYISFQLYKNYVILYTLCTFTFFTCIFLLYY